MFNEEVSALDFILLVNFSIYRFGTLMTVYKIHCENYILLVIIEKNELTYSMNREIDHHNNNYVNTDV